MPYGRGSMVGKYEIVSAIGAGGMGEVFLATDTRLDRQVALKILPAAFEHDVDRRWRFTREARAAAAISHPNVATIYEIGDSGGVTYIAMEYVAGATLAARIIESPISFDEMADIAIQIAEGLHAAHTQGVVHRDIKPYNVMLSATRQIKVLDFGLAKHDRAAPTHTVAGVATVEATTPGIVMGTVAYMSPEQAIGAPLDCRTDIFSLGVVLYQMATGRLPFRGSTDLHTIDLIRHGQPDAVARHSRNAPPDVERIILKCLQKQPEQRYQTARELVLDLETLRRLQQGGQSRPPDTHRHNLPAELTSFVGRQRELAELPRTLAATRLLTLTGAGGAGKTRLAIRLASGLVSDYSGGVWLVDLAPLSAPDLVAQTVATVVGIREGPQRSVRDSLLEHLRDREVLLVLDNCEHLIDACAELVEVLLRGASSLRIIATSREALGIPGETVCRVPSLSLPSSPGEAPLDSEATRLFIERAVATEPGFSVPPASGAVIAEICRRLDGIPLAIELAAARVSVLSVDQINTKLQDRFRLLTGGTRTAVARQRTLEATVDWSYQLLPDAERQLLSRLSAFPAGWTLDAAENVCGGDGIDAADTLDLLSRLVAKSLVALERDFAGEHRYRLLETVRQFARERLLQAGASDRLRQRHFEFFFSEFRGVSPVLRHGNQLACLRQLRIEQENIRTALEWALESPPLAERGLELAGALFWFWTKRGLFEEGKMWLERALAVNTPGALRAPALIGLAHMHHFQGRHAEVGACADEVLSVAGADREWAVPFALFMQALSSFELGNHHEAEARCVKAREAANASGQPVHHSGPLMILANIAMARGDHDRAQELYEESIDVCREAGEIWGLGILLSVAAGLRIVRGNFDQARAQASEALLHCQELEDPRGIAWSLDVFAALSAAGGFPDAAARLWGASDGLLASVGGSLNPTISWIRDRYFESAKTALGVEPFVRARAEGRVMSPQQAVALARQQTPVH